MGPFPRLHIHRFRGLRDIDFEDCGSVNLLVGGNNCGKTSVLEALLLLGAPLDVRQWEAATLLRTAWPLADMRFRGGGLDRLDSLAWLFPHQDEQLGTVDLSGGGPFSRITASAQRIVGQPPDKPVNQPDEFIEARFHVAGGRFRQHPLFEDPEPGLTIEIKLERHPSKEPNLEGVADHFRMVLWQSSRSYRIDRKSLSPKLPMAFVTPISHRSDGYLASRVSRILRAKRKDRAVKLLQRLDPCVIDLLMVAPDEAESSVAVPRRSLGAALHVEYKGVGLVPIHALGDGMRRALHFAAVVAEIDKGGVMLVDEIEVGMHASVLTDVFAWLCEACGESEIQLFATTHSLDAVDAMLHGAQTEDIVLYRIKDSQARRFSGDVLRTIRMDLGQEVR